MGYVVWIFGLMVAGIGGVMDLRTRRLPNWLTVPSFLLGIALNTYLGHWQGLKASLMGAGICFGVLLPFVMLRALGAGDWKLMGAMGSILGPAAAVLVMLATTFVAGAMAIVQMVAKRRIRETLANIWILIKVASVLGWKDREHITLDSPNAAKLPFGVATACATLICFLTIGLRAYRKI